MSHLFLIRHGQSEWNLQKRFTGWADVDLTAAGKLEACKAGELIKNLKIEISFYYSSYQIRALNTLKLILNTIRIKEDNIIKAWQLNERHYGELTGLKKDEMKKILGEEKIFKFRRSWDFPPGPLSRSNPYHPLNIERYNDIPRDKIPDTESLKETHDRVVNYYSENIKNNLDKNILVVAHGNSIRALCKHLFDLDNDAVSKLEIPTGNPLLINIDNNIVKKAKYLDTSRAKNLLKF